MYYVILNITDSGKYIIFSLIERMHSVVCLKVFWYSVVLLGIQGFPLNLIIIAKVLITIAKVLITLGNKGFSLKMTYHFLESCDTRY